MRLFTGIPIPDSVKDALGALIDRLRPTARLSWSPVRNLHITTKFIGEWPPARLDEITSALAQVPVEGAIRIGIEGIGWLPNLHSPRVFLASVNAPEKLARLARETEQGLARLGIAVEKRSFAPHLTLARIRDQVPLDRVRQAVASLDTVEFGSFEAREFHLYSSELRPGGSIYTSLATYPLTR